MVPAHVCHKAQQTIQMGLILPWCMARGTETKSWHPLMRMKRLEQRGWRVQHCKGQHKHSSEQGKFTAIRAASGALRGVAQPGVTPLCIPLSLPTTTCLQNCWLPPFASPAISLGSRQPQKEQPAAGSPGAMGQFSSSVVTQGSGLQLLPCVSWSLPFPRLLLGVKSLAVVLLPSSCHRPPQQTKNSTGNNSPWKAWNHPTSANNRIGWFIRISARFVSIFPTSAPVLLPRGDVFLHACKAGAIQMYRLNDL